MRLRGKYLCWLFVMMVFCAVSFGGCGGSSTSSVSGSEDVYVPETPNTENPENVTPSPTPNISPDVQSAPAPNASPDVQPEPEDTPGSGENVSSGLNGTWEVVSASYSIDYRGKTYNFTYIEGSTLTFTILLTTTSYYDEGFYTIALSGDAVAESDRHAGEVLGIENYHQMFGGVPVEFSNDDNYPNQGETVTYGFSGGNSFQYDEDGTYKILSVNSSGEYFYPTTFTVKDNSHVQVVVRNISNTSSSVGIYELQRVN